MFNIICCLPPTNLNNDSLYGFNQLNITDYSCNSSYSANCIYFTNKLKKNAELVKSFEKLDDNWNGYGAGKISRNVISFALTAIYLIKIQPDVFPTGRNSIQFEYEKKNGDYLEFEIFDNYISMFRIIENEEFEKKIESTELNKMVEEFYARV